MPVTPVGNQPESLSAKLKTCKSFKKFKKDKVNNLFGVLPEGVGVHYL